MCETYNKRFLYESLLKRHTPIHSDTKDHKCPSHNCGKTFKSRQSLKAHLELHSGEQFACLCLGCPKTFASKHYRKDHMNMQHSEPYQWKWALNGCNFTTRACTTLHRYETISVFSKQRRMMMCNLYAYWLWYHHAVNYLGICYHIDVTIYIRQAGIYYGICMCICKIVLILYLHIV